MVYKDSGNSVFGLRKSVKKHLIISPLFIVTESVNQLSFLCLVVRYIN